MVNVGGAARIGIWHGQPKDLLDGGLHEAHAAVVHIGAVAVKVSNDRLCTRHVKVTLAVATQSTGKRANRWWRR